jgi:hypothetical protein
MFNSQIPRGNGEAARNARSVSGVFTTRRSCMKSSLFRSVNAFVFVVALALTPAVFAAGQQDYTFTTSSGASIVPGTDDSGNHVDDFPLTPISLPFPVVFYDQVFQDAQLTANGYLVFTSASSYNFCVEAYWLGPAGP